MSLLSNAYGDPNPLGTFFFMAVLFSPVYGLLHREIFYVIIGAIVLFLLFLDKGFRNEFSTPYGGMFFLTMAVHFGYSFYFFGTSTFNLSALLLNVATYLIVSVVYIIWTRDWGEARTAGAASLAAVAFYSLAPLISNWAAGSDFEAIAIFLIVLLPVWPLFMLMRLSHAFPYGYATRMFRMLTTLLVIFGLILAVWVLVAVLPRTLLFPSFEAGTGFDVRERVFAGWEAIKDKIVEVFKGLLFLRERAENPDAYYRSLQEDDTIGVEFANVWGHAEQMLFGDPFFVEGMIAVYPSENQEKQETIERLLGPTVLVTPSCLLGTATTGSAQPAVLDIRWGSIGQFVCEFPKVEEKGTRRVKVDATFSFYQDVSGQYTFVNAKSERAQQLLAEEELAEPAQRDPAQLSLNSVTGRDDSRARTSFGPVCLGIPDVTVLVDTDKRELSYARLPFTIDDCNSRGESEISRIEEARICVPKALRLVELTVPPANPAGTPDPQDLDYTCYTFTVNDFEPGWFTTVSGKIEIADPSFTDRFTTVVEDVLLMRGSVKYKYNIADRSVTVAVRT